MFGEDGQLGFEDFNPQDEAPDSDEVLGDVGGIQVRFFVFSLSLPFFLSLPFLSLPFSLSSFVSLFLSFSPGRQISAQRNLFVGWS